MSASKIKNILVSQPAPAIVEKSPFYDLVTKYDVNVDFIPFIKIEGVSLKEYRSQRVEILDHTAVIFTSKTTIDNFFRICEQARISIPETMKYLCNSEAIALYLQKYIVYRKRKISFADGTFPNFMELIIKHKNEKLLLTLAEPHKPELPDTMEKLNIPFSKLILSRTVSADLSDLDISKYDLLVYYSPAEINTLTSVFNTDTLPYIATFGNGTARAAIDAGICLNVMAPTEKVPSMAKAIDIFISQIESGEEVSPVELCEKREVEEFIRAQVSKPAKKCRPKKA